MTVTPLAACEADGRTAPRISVVIPARNEAARIGRSLSRIFASVRSSCEVIVIVDDEEDPTWQEVQARAAAEPRLRCLVGEYGPGPANAIRFGIDQARAGVAVVTMADNSDDPRQIEPLAALVENGAAVAAASRYSKGGSQIGGPIGKSLLSRLAGRSLRLLARACTRDATNSFKAYSTSFIREVGIDSRQGFVIGIELTAKARRPAPGRSRDPHHLARPRRWRIRVPDPGLDARLPALVPVLLRPAADRRRTRRPLRASRAARARAGPARLRSDTAGAQAHAPERVGRLACHRAEGRARRCGPGTRGGPVAGSGVTGRVLVTGAAGFIGGYVVAELLRRGYRVVGLDNLSKYGELRTVGASRPGYRFVRGDARDTGLVTELLAGCEHFVAAAAMVGGIGYFHAYPYDLLAANERITAAACDAAIAARRDGALRKITFRRHRWCTKTPTLFPSREGQQLQVPPPATAYGFQKLAVEYFAQGAWEQYRLPYTILRPFNCVTWGRPVARDGRDVQGEVQLASSHVVPTWSAGR